MNEKKKYIKIAIDYIAFLIALIFVVAFLPKLVIFFMPFLIGWIISAIANPIVKVLENRVKILRKHSSAFIIAFVIGVVCFVLYLVGSIVGNQLYNMIKEMPDMVASFKVQTADIVNKMSTLYDRLPESMQAYILRIKHEITSFDGGTFSVISISNASSAVKSVAEVVFGMIFSILSAYFFTAERDIIADSAKKYLPEPITEKLQMIVSYFATAVGGYFKAQFKIMIILVAIMFVVFQAFGVNYSFLIAIGIGLLDLLPVFGTGAVLWPWTVYLLLTGKYYFGVALVILYFICQLVKQFLQPKMVGDSIGLSPLTTLVLLFFGYKIGGLVGILIAIPLGLVIINLYRAGTFDILVDDTRFIIGKITIFCEENMIKKEDIQSSADYKEDDKKDDKKQE